MKKIRERDKPGFWPVIILMIAVILLSGVFYGTVYGASYNHPITVTQSPRHDSTLIVIYSDSANKYDSTVAFDDTLLVLNDVYNYTITEIDFWDGVAGYGFDDPPTILREGLGSSGLGLYTYNVVALDTLGTDSVVSGVKTTVQNTLTSDSWSRNTDGNGIATHSIDSMSYDVLGNKSGYIFTTYRDTVTGNETDTIYGYNFFVVVTQPSDTSLCMVNGQAFDLQQNPIQYGRVVITPSERNFNTCDSTISLAGSYETTTNSAGYFEIEVIKSSCVGDIDYGIKVTGVLVNTGIEVETPLHTFEIPADSTTYKVVW